MDPNDPLHQPSPDATETPERLGDPFMQRATQAPPPTGYTLQPPPHREPRKPHPGFWWSLLWCIGFVLVTQVPGAIVAVMIIVFLSVTNKSLLEQAGNATPGPLAVYSSPGGVAAFAAAFVVNELLVVGVSLLVIRLVVGPDWPRRLALRRPGLIHSALVVLSLPALVLLGNLTYEILRSVLHLPSFSDLGLGGMEEMVKVFNKWPWGLAVLVIGLGPGIGEELWCRGFLGRGLVGRYGVFWGVLASSFFFGLIHVDPCQGTMAMIMGLWLHFVYLTTRSLLAPMFLHFCNNSLAVVASRLPLLGQIEDNAIDIPWYVFAAAAVLLAAVAYALYQSRARLAPANGEGPDFWQPPYPSVEYPPPGSGTTVVHPRPSTTVVVGILAGIAGFVVACCLAFRS
jgi:membrane protease YdiL (CAAX protease family)